MKTSVQFFLFFIAFVVFVGLGWYLGSRPGFFAKEKRENVQVVMEQIRNISKLATIEADFSEIYSYKDYYTYDLFPLRKQALVRVSAKVLAGIDLSKLDVRIDSVSQQVHISQLPPAELLSVDHTLEYYDITEGIFNSFSAEDYNLINKNAKKYIQDVATKKGILTRAESQSKIFLESLNPLLKGLGYTLVIDPDPDLLQ